jgi:hypothetical protein
MATHAEITPNRADAAGRLLLALADSPAVGPQPSRRSASRPRSDTTMSVFDHPRGRRRPARAGQRHRPRDRRLGRRLGRDEAICGGDAYARVQDRPHRRGRRGHARLHPRAFRRAGPHYRGVGRRLGRDEAICGGDAYARVQDPPAPTKSAPEVDPFETATVYVTKGGLHGWTFRAHYEGGEVTKLFEALEDGLREHSGDILCFTEPEPERFEVRALKNTDRWVLLPRVGSNSGWAVPGRHIRFGTR